MLLYLKSIYLKEFFTTQESDTNKFVLKALALVTPNSCISRARTSHISLRCLMQRKSFNSWNPQCKVCRRSANFANGKCLYTCSFYMCMRLYACMYFDNLNDFYRYLEMFKITSWNAAQGPKTSWSHAAAVHLIIFNLNQYPSMSAVTVSQNRVKGL